MVWMVFVKGMSKPKKRHATLENARNEAIRLSAIVPARDVYILELVEVIKATQKPVEAVQAIKVTETPVVVEAKEDVKLEQVVKLPIITIKKVGRIVKP